MTTDNDTAAALAFADNHALPDRIDLTDDLTLVRVRTEESWDAYDLEKYGSAPRRSRGTVNVHDAHSFVVAVTERGAATAYADEEKTALVAILNDDSPDFPGWRDYRVSLALRPTPEWTAWKDGQQLGDQQRFAERIEDGLPEIVEPAGAIMLEIAQTFHASVGVEFRSANRLTDGQTQLAYIEDTKASAGKAGNVTIPETFKLVVRPFIGSDRFEVDARLRYRVAGGKLQIGYVLVRPDEVERNAFNDVVATAQAGLEGTTFLAGPAPSPAS